MEESTTSLFFTALTIGTVISLRYLLDKPVKKFLEKE